MADRIGGAEQLGNVVAAGTQRPTQRLVHRTFTDFTDLGAVADTDWVRERR
jgi:hypothetical protein